MATFNYSIYGFSNLDWTIPWVDILGNRMNDATFDSSRNIPGTFTYYTKPTDTSGIAQNSIYYYAELNKIYLYDYNGIPVQRDNSIPLINYVTSQYGNYYFNNNSNNYVFPNLDYFNITNLKIQLPNSSYLDIDNFLVYRPIYDTNYTANYLFDLNKSNGCQIPSDVIYLKSNLDTTSNNIYNFIYELYYSSSINIPLNLRNTFNIDEDKSYNILTNVNSFANYNANNTYYQYFNNNYGNALNTSWFIINVICYAK
jgi:hypothetical protein